MRLRDHLQVALDDLKKFRETAWQVERSFDKASVRFLSLIKGEVSRLTSAPVIGTDGMPKLDVVDPYFLDTAFQSLSGQSVVVTGNVVGDLLYFAKNGDDGLSILVSDIKRAARESDINLVILNTGEPLQPGGRDLAMEKNRLLRDWSKLFR